MKINTIGHLVKANPIQTQSNPISVKPKMNVNVFITKDYENDTALRPKKQTQTNPISNRKSEVRCQKQKARLSIICLLFSVFCPLFSDAAQIIEFSRQKKFDSLVEFVKIPFFV